MSNDFFNDFATDEAAEVEGTWVDFNGAQLLVARHGNKKYVKLLTKLVDRNKQALDRKDDNADTKSDEIMIEVMAKTILLGWRTSETDLTIKVKGKQEAYSDETAKLLLSNKDFRKAVAGLADDFEAFKLKQEEDQTKN